MGSGSTRRPILVLGIGNLIQTDDGAGIHALELLRQCELPDAVELYDGGTAGVDLLPVIEDRELVLVLDAVDGGRAPGTCYRFDPGALDQAPVTYTSVHQIGLLDLLGVARSLGRAPARTVVFGIQPDTIGWGLSLTEPVQLMLPGLVKRVVEEIEQALEQD